MGVCFIRHGWPKLPNQDLVHGDEHPSLVVFPLGFSMWASGIALLLGFCSLAFAILTSMAYAVVLEIRAGTLSSLLTLSNSRGITPARWGLATPELGKASMYVVMCLVLFCGGGFFSLDNLLIAGSLQAWGITPTGGRMVEQFLSGKVAIVAGPTPALVKPLPKN